jgi:hypothetical protein
MKDTVDCDYLAPAVATEIFEFRNDGDIPPYIVVENTGPNAVALKYEESDDGVTWSDITGTPVAINPGDSDAQVVVSSRSRIACHAGGNSNLNVKLVRQANGSPYNLGPIN